MGAMSNLQKHPKSGVYRINKRIPEAAQAAFGGRKVFLRSLGTKDLAQAKRKALTVLAEFQDRVDRAVSGSILQAPLDLNVIRNEFVRKSDWFGKSHHADRVHLPTIYRDRSEFQADLDQFSGSRFTDPHDADRFRRYLEETIPDLYPGMNRAPAIRVNQKSISLTELEAKLLQQHSYAKRSEQDLRKAFEYLRELFGDCPAGDIQAGHIRELRDCLLRYPVSNRTDKVRKLGLREAAKSDWPHTMNPRTIKKLLGFLSSGFKLALSEGWAEVNPVRDVQLPKRTATSRSRPRVDWRPQDLTKLFSSPIWTGAKSAARLTESGQYFEQGYKRWLPWIGLYTGARLTELTQLETTDILQDQGIWYFDITDRSDTDEPGDNGDGSGKHLKTPGSTRMVPVHRDLIQRGFIDWFRGLNRKGFLWEFDYPNPDILSREYSKWFLRYNRAIGINIPGLVFHSFRHSFASAGRLANMMEEINECLRGAKPQRVAAKYGENKRLIETLRDNIDMISYKGLPTQEQ